MQSKKVLSESVIKLVGEEEKDDSWNRGSFLQFDEGRLPEYKQLGDSSNGMIRTE